MGIILRYVCWGTHQPSLGSPAADLPTRQLLRFGSTKGGGGGFPPHTHNPQNGCTLLGVTYWLPPTPVGGPSNESPSPGPLLLLQLYVTGHSLGGAIATLAAYEISKLYPKHRLVLYTFGSPRVGNYTFKHAFDRQVPCAWRLANERVCSKDSP